MLNTTNYILKSPELTDSQNYVLLRQEGLECIENLGRDLWTDYNVHDPGVTFLEYICYAITDLGYRTGFDIKDLLTEEKDGEPFIDQTSLHTAADIFPSAPVTFNDLRKILIDITGVKQAWIGINKNVIYNLNAEQTGLTYAGDDADLIQCPPLNGLYDVLIQKEDFVQEEDRTLFLERIDPSKVTLDYIPASNQGIQFLVRYPIVMKSVVIYVDIIDPNIPAGLRLKFFKKDITGTYREAFRKEYHLVTQGTDKKFHFPINEQLDSGEWRVTAKEISAGNLTCGVNNAATFPKSVLGVIDITSGYAGTPKFTKHHFLFDIELSYAVSPVLKEKVNNLTDKSAVLGAADNSISGSGNYLQVNDQGLLFHALCQTTLDQISVYPEAAGTFELKLLDQKEVVIESKLIELIKGGTLTPIDLDWSIAPGLNYKIKAFQVGGRPLKLYKNDAVTFPFARPNVLEIVSGIDKSSKNDTYFFFYNWQFTYTPCLPQTTEITLADINEAVKEKLYIHRNLCEDFMNIEVLKTEEISVCMDLEVTPDADLEEILAEIYYQLEIHVSPPVNFYSIQELLDKGKTTDTIFEGPLLDHGFIDDDEFMDLDRRSCLRTSDIIQIIMDVPGVLAVKSIALLSFVQIEKSDINIGDTIHEEEDENGVKNYYRVTQEDWLLQLQDTNFFAPDFSPERSKTFFYKNNLPYLANRTETKDLLAEKRAQQIRSKLLGHQKDLPVPVGNYRDLEDYYPIQNELPETYYTGANLVPDSRSNLRKAQSNQLKGYLLFFEQILANHLSQLGNIKDLFSWDKTSDHRSYFTQPITEIAEIESLYIDHQNLNTRLNAIIETEEAASERKNKFLDHLIGRFSEDLSQYSLMLHSVLKDQADSRLLMDKQAFLNDYPRLSSERAKGFDYRYPNVYDNITGFQRRIYRLLGIHDDDCTVGRKNFSSPRIKLLAKIEDGKTVYFFRLLLTEDSPDSEYVFESNYCESREQICTMIDTLIPFAAKLENWCPVRDVVTDEIIGWALKRTCISCKELAVLIKTGDPRLAEEVLGYSGPTVMSEEDLQTLVIDHFALYAKCEGFHLIENILLRKRSIEEEGDFLPISLNDPKEDCSCVEVKDPYSFRATVVLPSWPIRFRSTRFRQFIETTLRKEAPAHIYLRICWINHCQMSEFEECHDEWLKRHAELDCKFRGEIALPSLSTSSELTAQERNALIVYRSSLKSLIEKIYTLDNIFTVARIHGCEDVDSEEPQLSLNNTSLGSL